MSTDVDDWIGQLYSDVRNAGHNPEGLRKFFHAGYCYYFAHMLKQRFQRGDVVWVAPFSHVAWRDTDGRVYDIEGELDGSEAFYFIPESYMPQEMRSFATHSCKDIVTKERLIAIVKEYTSAIGVQYDPRIEEWFTSASSTDVQE